MRRRASYWKEVFKHAIRAAGWTAGIATVVFGGSIVTAGGFLLHYHHRTLAVIVLASGLLIATLEGSYRVWDATARRLAVLAQARPSLTGTRRRLVEELGEAKRELESLGDGVSSWWTKWQGTVGEVDDELYRGILMRGLTPGKEIHDSVDRLLQARNPKQRQERHEDVIRAIDRAITKLST
jgi:hypothetical protein